MNIDINGFSRGGGVGWNAVAGQVNSAGAAENVKNASPGSVRDAVTFSAGGNDGVRGVPSSVPQLDGPTVTDESRIESLCAKLGTGNLMNLSPAQVETVCKNLTNELKAYADALAAGGASGVDTSGDSKSVMFDIYALMALLVECGQKMRDAARDVRQAENEQVQTSIQAQADQQRSAAFVGLVSSICVCAIQVGMQGVNLWHMSSGMGKQLSAHKNAGIADAKAQLDAAKMQAKPQDAQANYEKVAAKTEQTVKDQVESTFNDSRNTKAGFDDTALDRRIADNTAELNGLKYGPGRQPEAGKELPMTKSQQAQAEKLQAQIDSDTRLKAMTPEQRQTLYRTQVKSELGDIRSDPDSTPVQKQYAEAYAARELSQNSTPEQLDADLLAAQENYNRANTFMQHDINYMKGVQTETKARLYGDMISAIGNVAQSCISARTEMKKAEATKMGAEQQAAQEMLDQAKDLFSQCQDVIDAVMQLMQAVLQAEVQSMRDAIQA